MKDLFSIESSVLPDDTRVVGFRGTEGLSRPYLFEIWLSIPSDAADFDMADAIGARTTLMVDRGDAIHPPHAVHGILWTLELLLESHGRALFRAELVPQLQQLTQTLHSRLFTKKALPDILKDTLEDGGLTSDDYELRLNETYEPEEHVCQYRESHFDFVSRWMEHEGIYYFFEQGDDREKLIITDHKAAHEALREGVVRYHPVASHDGSAGESFDSFTCRHVSLPASVKLIDYDYLKPTLEMTGTAPVSSTGLGEIIEHGARFFTPAGGKRLAKLRAAALLAQQVVYHASGAVLHLRAGYLFELDDHPRSSFNIRYLVTELTHIGNQGASTAELRQITGLEAGPVYHVDLTAIPADVQFRPSRRTAWPRIYGYENGTIDGEADSEYAQIDEHGRYAVKFKFDESELRGGKASTFVRMAQPHGGDIEGFHFPLRKGTEVIFSFLDGDPDRPVIASVVPNAQTPSAVTRANHTTNVIQTGGRNYMIIEDYLGKQHIDIHTPTDDTTLFMGGPQSHLFIQPPTAQVLSCEQPLRVSVASSLLLNTAGSGGLDVGHNWYENIGENYWKNVTGTATIQYGKIHTINVNADSNEFYNFHQNIKVGKGRTDDIHGGLTQTIEPTWTSTVTGDWTQTVTKDVKWDITGNVDIKCNEWKVTQDSEVLWECLTNKTELTKGISTETFIGISTETHIGLKNEVLIGGKLGLTVAAAVEVFVGGKAELTVAKATEMTIGDYLALKAASETSITVGAATEIFAGLKMGITGGVAIELFGGLKVELEAGFKIDNEGAGKIETAPIIIVL